MEKILKRIKPKYYWIVSFTLGALAMYLMLSYSQMLSTGKYVIIGGDAMEIYVPNIRMFVRSILNGESIWYSFSTSMGYNTALSAAYELFSPFNILFILFPKADVNIILAAVIILKVGLAAMCFQLFASRALDLKGVSSVIFSVFYGMCGYVTVYCITNFMWLDGVYMLPVVAWAVHYTVHKKKYIYLCLAYTYIFIVQFYMGYVLGLFSILYFFLLLFLDSEKKAVKEYFLSCLHYFLTVAVSIAASAVVWVPVTYFLLHHYATDSTVFAGAGTNPLEIINGFFWGEFYDYYSFPYVFCGVISIILSVVFFIIKNNSFKEKIIYGVLLLFFIMGCFWLPLYKMLHGFDAPDMWNWRFSFVISFIVCILACKQMQSIGEHVRITAIVSISMVAFYILILIMYRLGFGYDSRNNLKGLIINAIIAGFWFLFLFLRNKKNKDKSAVVISLLLLAMTEVVTNGCVRTFNKTWKTGLTSEKYFRYWENDLNDTLLQVKQMNGNDDFYRVCVLNDVIHNSDSYFGYHGITDFNTAENENLRNTLGNLGLYTSPRLTTTTGITPSLEMLLGIKYVIRIYPDTKLAGIDAAPRLYENECCLPIGYLVSSNVLEDIEWKRNVFENQNELLKRMTGVEDVFVSVSKENVDIETNGVAFFEDFPTKLLRTEYGEGNAIFYVREAQGRTFMQLEVQLDDEDGSGIEMIQSLNQGNKLDRHINNEYAIEMFSSSDGNYYYGIQTDETYDSTLLVNNVNIYCLNNEKMQQIYGILNDSGLVIDTLENGFVKGTISVVDADKNVLFTSIPYTDGWEVRVNGEKTDVSSVLNNSFIAVELPGTGEYMIEMVYKCPGLKQGLMLSCFGISLLFAWIIVRVSKRKGC